MTEGGETRPVEKPAGTPSLSTVDVMSEIDAQLIVHGRINLWRTHPNLYLAVTTLAVVNIALGLNFLLLDPTFLIYGSPNQLWGAIFIALGVSKLVFLNVARRLRAVRAVMATAVAYLLFLGVGTAEPFYEGLGSLQLPILYVSLAALQIPLVIEPFINPWTAKR